MAIGLMKQCFQCFEGVEGIEGGHLRSPEIRTFENLGDIEEVLDIVQCKWLRAAVAAGPGGAVMILRRDDGQFECAFYVEGDVVKSAVFASIGDVGQWLRENFIGIDIEPTVNAARNQ